MTETVDAPVVPMSMPRTGAPASVAEHTGVEPGEFLELVRAREQAAPCRHVPRGRGLGPGGTYAGP